MKDLEFCVPCLFGLEGLVGDELKRLGCEGVRVEDRRVFFTGDFADLAKVNLCCRMGERVMIRLGHFRAMTEPQRDGGICKANDGGVVSDVFSRQSLSQLR